MADKINCPRCKEPKDITAITGRFCRLSCKHLIAYNLDEVIKEKPEEVEEEFVNIKTGDKPYPFQVRGIDFVKNSGFKCLIAD